MPRYEAITSFQNNKIKLAQKLRDKHYRERERLFMVDYVRDFERALQQGYDVEFLLFSPTTANQDEKAVVEALNQVIYTVTPDILSKASYRENPGGIVAVLRQKPIQTSVEAITAQHILALVDLRKPGNIGALLRTADAAGFTAIILVDTTLDLYNPNIIRSSTGACFLGNIYSASSMSALNFFKQANYQLVAGHLEGQTTLFDVNFRQKTVLVLGTEDTGLRTVWADNCDHLVKIPMMGQLTDSLNVSVSGAIFMYEALRQIT